MSQYNFCTLFDRNYLYKGLALYRSLLATCPQFRLWILCMDDITYGLLSKLKPPNIELISLADFEDAQLIEVKKNRTQTEYCWTCTSSLPLYIFKKAPELDSVTYIDADLFFYSNPSILYEDLNTYSVLILSHNYSLSYRGYERFYGKYNVQLLVFKNDKNSLDCLNWWRSKCLEWCYLKYENGKWGDQKYLDDWIERFPGIGVIQHKGAGVAPWNIQRYSVKKYGADVFVDEDKLICYHFHQLNILSSEAFDLSRGYILSPGFMDIIYKPYVEELSRVIDFVSHANPEFHYGFDLEYALRPSSFMDTVKSIILKNKAFRDMLRRYIGKYIGKSYYLYKLDKKKQGVI